jgi:iron complex outermembrane recepter protein
MSKGLWRCSCLVVAFWGLAAATPAGAIGDDLLTLSLEDLLSVEVTSVAKRTQRLSDVPAAVFVITADDIRRSGARSLPEVLRLAPGVDASSIGGDRWAVSIRGFAEYLSAKLMVLVDGRNAYSPNFSGVLWNTLQFPLENIERIEVIRGPGGSIWGANAVNGVVNIITRPAIDMQDTLLSAGYGNDTGGFAVARRGSALGEHGYVTGFVQGRRGEPGLTLDGREHDDSFRHLSAGFRGDWEQGMDSWMLVGNLYRARSDGLSNVPDPTDPTLASSSFTQLTPFTDDFAGISLHARFTRRLANASELEVNASWLHEDLDSALLAREKQHIIDIELQHRLRLADRHDLIWGAGYRRFEDNISAGILTRINPPSESLNFFSLYAQGETPLHEYLRLILGARLDHNDYTGAEFQPTARLLWNVSPVHTLWSSFSQARRIPSRGERTADFLGTVLPPGSLPLPPPLDAFPVQTELRMSNKFESEQLTAFEIGYRGQLHHRLYLDATAFIHRYRDLRSYPAGGLEFAGTHLVLPSFLANQGRLTLRGIELVADWRPSDDWRFQASYAYSDVNENLLIGSSFVPRNIASLRASWNVNQQIDLDLWLRHVGERPVAGGGLPVDAYTTLDLRAAWRPTKSVELALVGQNLIGSERQEFESIVPSLVPARARRGIYGQVKLGF